jgi:protein gp37
MGDLFHESVPDEWIDQVFAIMALTPRNTYQLLTKRAARMRDYFAAEHTAPKIKAWQARVSAAIDDIVPQRTDASRLAKMAVLAPEPLPNVWLGVSTERQQEADERICLLLKTPAAVRFISAEPLLGRIDLTTLRPGRTYEPFRCAQARFDVHGTRAGQRFYHSSRQPTLDWVIVGGELRRRPQSGAFTDILTED